MKVRYSISAVLAEFLWGTKISNNPNPQNVLVTGATGLVGDQLIDQFQDVVITSRRAGAAERKLGNRIRGAIQWDPSNQGLDLTTHQPFRAVVNLMGEPIAGSRWNPEKKARIRASRVDGTRALVGAILNLDSKPKVVVSASAVGFYGDCGGQVLTESDSAGSGFLPETCAEWEGAAAPLAEAGIRLVIVRIGIVLSNRGGALAEMLPVFKKGLGGRLGSGQQFFPWIHGHDLVRLLVWAVSNKTAHGVYNAVAPGIVTNREFTSHLATALKRPAFLPVPKFALRLILGEFADSLFHSQRVTPQASLRDGFAYEFPDLQPALADLLPA